MGCFIHFETNKGKSAKKIMFPNPFQPIFTIVTFIHYKPQIAVAILDL